MFYKVLFRCVFWKAIGWNTTAHLKTLWRLANQSSSCLVHPSFRPKIPTLPPPCLKYLPHDFIRHGCVKTNLRHYLVKSFKSFNIISEHNKEHQKTILTIKTIIISTIIITIILIMMPRPQCHKKHLFTPRIPSKKRGPSIAAKRPPAKQIPQPKVRASAG